MSSTKCTRDPRVEGWDGFHQGRYALRVHIAALMHPTPHLHSDQGMGKGLRERWAVEKDECVREGEKRVIFGKPWSVSEWGALYQTYDSASLQNMCSRNEFRREVST